MTTAEQLALEQGLKELNNITAIVNEVLYVQGFQQLQAQFAQKLTQLNDIFKDLTED